MISARQDSQYLQMLVITYYLLPAYLQRHRGIVPKSSGLRRNKYYPLNWNPTSGFFNTSYPHRDGLWGTSPLISSDHAEPSQIVPANSDQARLINPSPRIFTLLPTAASERCVPSEIFSPIIYQSPTSTLAPWVRRRQEGLHQRGGQIPGCLRSRRTQQSWSPSRGNRLA